VLRERTWWDWLQILIVPLAIALIVFMLDSVSALLQAANEAQQQQQALVMSSRQQRQLEEQRAQAASFQAYLDQMSQLLLENDLRSSEEGSNVRALAQARTTSVMEGRLDSDREGILLQFLYEAKLINKRNPIVVLTGQDASDVDLSRTVLGGAYLKGVDLTDADLSGAQLTEADLSCAPPVYWWMKSNQSCTDLSGANLSGASLNQANLSCAPAAEWWMEVDRTDCVDLRKADLSGADLAFADLSGANLTDANVTQEQLDQATLWAGL
jgi:uncharacterized protein YjbI with pentapeptide repeats